MVASFTERIKIVIDVVGDKATTQVKSFRQAVAEADGVTGKFKAGIKSLGAAFTSMSSSPSAMASAALAANAAVGKLVQKAMDLTLAVGDLSAKTGLTADEASRWYEVTNDLGISSDVLAGAIKKMSMAMDPDVFASYGIEIVKTDLGTTNMSATLLNVIDRLNQIKDPAERARVATKLLGKNWQELAELIEAGGTRIESRLKDVADAKIVDDAQIENARKLRDSLDDLSDAGENLSLIIGDTLLPKLTGMIESINSVLGKATDESSIFGQAFSYALDKITGKFGPFGTVLDVVTDVWDQIFGDPIDKSDPLYKWAEDTFAAFKNTSLAAKLGIKSVDDLFRALRDGKVTQQDAASAARTYNEEQSAAAAMYGEYTNSLIAYHEEVSGTAISEKDAAATKDALARSAQAAAVAIDLQRRANDELLGSLDDGLAELDLISFFDELPDKLAELKRQYGQGKIDARQYWLDTAREVEGAKLKLADYLINVRNLDADVVTTFIADITGAEGEIDRVLAKVAKYEQDKKISLERGGVGAGLATGGYASGITLVGERGPELVDLPGGSTVHNNVATRRLLGSINQPVAASSSMVNVNVMSADPQAVVAAIKKYQQRGGRL